MENERFTLESGRKRPEYKAKEIRCPNCDAQIRQKDERSELLVCEYCNSHIDVSEEEKRVLEKGGEKLTWFKLKVGDSFLWENIRYEVLARLAQVEYDDDESYWTSEYLLFNPHRGTLWLSEYEGEWSLSMNSHLMPDGNIASAFTKDRGEIIETADKRKWMIEDSGTYTLHYVDGALPWKAQKGDKTDYAECIEKSGGKEIYEITRSKGEYEFGYGRSISYKELYAATQKNEFNPAKNKPKKKKGSSIVSQQRQFKAVIAAAVIALVVNFFLWVSAVGHGTLTLEQDFSPEELTTETFSKPFTVARSNDIVRLETYAPLDNAWMSLDVGVVKGDDALIHVFDNDISYYSGTDSEGSWSEGNRHVTSYIKIPTEGEYRLFLHAVSGSGNSNSAEVSQYPVRIKVYTNAVVHKFFIFSMVISLIVLIVAVFLHHCWKNQENPFEMLGELLGDD